MNRKATLAATIVLAAVTLTGCDAGGVVTSRCDGPNRVYTTTSGIAVVKDDPRCTHSKG